MAKLNATERGANAAIHGGNRRRGRDWPDMVGRRDVQIGEFGRDIAAC
jgi:hypothetical protein